MEIAVIGSGPVGIYIAHRLLQAGKNVTLYESGFSSSESVHLNRNSYVFTSPSALPHNVHRLGGGANYWMSRVSEFSDSDFEDHESRPGINWPISISEMRDLYSSLDIELLPGQPKDSEIKKILLNQFTDSLPDGLTLRTFRYINSGFFTDLLVSLKANPKFTLKEGHFCKRFLNRSDGRVELHLETPGGRVVDVVNRAVISCGALQTPFLVARSVKVQERDASGIGTGLMEHIEGYIGTLKISKPGKSLPRFNGICLTLDRKIPGQNFGAGIAIVERLSKLNGWPNFQIEIVPFIPEYRFSKYLVNKVEKSPQRLISSILKRLAFCERAIKKSMHFAYQRICRLRGVYFYSLWLKSEEFPNPESSVTFDFDSEKVRYNHKISQITQDKLREGLRFFKETIEQSSPCEVSYYKSILENSENLYLRPNWHPMGTLPMNPRLRTPFVGKNQNLVGFQNVYICDASIFPTGSYSNPVYTALALALRLTNFLNNSD